MLTLTLYYDGNCALCRAQMARLRQLDTACRLGFSDIAAPDFFPEALGVSKEALGTEIHALTADGRLMVGLDSIIAAYTAVGRGWLVAPLRIGVLRPLFVAMYRGLARHRYRLSRCADGVCKFGGRP